MRVNFLLLPLLLIMAVRSRGQNGPILTLTIGYPAPPLQVRDWLKGKPFQSFDKGRIYVIEFWATWCAPCIASMPHLSSLALNYKDKVTILGIDTKEKKTTSLQKVKAFVDSLGNRMNYDVAIEDSNFMQTEWFDASGEQGIPKTFVVDADGRLAWIGHPRELDDVLYKIVNNNWNINEALAKRNLNRRLAELDDSAMHVLNKYMDDPYKKNDPGEPDSALYVIEQIIRKEPGLRYAPVIATSTFSALLRKDAHKAYEFGKIALATFTYEDPPYGLFIGTIDWYSKKLNLPGEIYELAAEAYQAKIDRYGEFGNIDIPKSYQKMADMYCHAKNKLKAIDAIQKAIEALKHVEGFSETDEATLKSLLRQYTKM
jgi:thiol-disulfide isomerase/thioredoxin